MKFRTKLVITFLTVIPVSYTHLGDGHPAEIMDMSFAIQALSAKYLVEHGREMTEMLIDVPVEIDEDVAARKLRFMGKEIDTLTAEQEAYLNKSLV